MDETVRNSILIGHARIYLSVVVGFVVGALAVEGLSGFLVYFGVCVVGLSVLVRLVVFKDKAGPWGDVFTHSVFSGLFTFALFWTLAFNLFDTWWAQT